MVLEGRRETGVGAEEEAVDEAGDRCGSRRGSRRRGRSGCGTPRAKGQQRSEERSAARAEPAGSAWERPCFFKCGGRRERRAWPGAPRALLGKSCLQTEAERRRQRTSRRPCIPPFSPRALRRPQPGGSRKAQDSELTGPGPAAAFPSVARGRRLRRGGGGDRGTSLAQPGARAGPSTTLPWLLPPESPAPPDPHAAAFSPAQPRRGRCRLPSIFQPPSPENQLWDVTEQADIILGPASLRHCSHHTTWPDPVRLECLGWCRRMFLLRCSTFRRPLCKQSPWPHRCPAQGAPRARVHTRTASLSQHLSRWTRAGRI
ncbi:uncharacterized protein isoform X2 [Macaca fascicularis]|uniref:uncharacterized protein isoform X2 n=1 Tax=Macaca fascicularis TaxID=9541 RepID=UPI003D156BAF